MTNASLRWQTFKVESLMSLLSLIACLLLSDTKTLVLTTTVVKTNVVITNVGNIGNQRQ